jgi:hypothetical protein
MELKNFDGSLYQGYYLSLKLGIQGIQMTKKDCEKRVSTNPASSVAYLCVCGAKTMGRSQKVWFFLNLIFRPATGLQTLQFCNSNVQLASSSFCNSNVQQAGTRFCNSIVQQAGSSFCNSNVQQASSSLCNSNVQLAGSSLCNSNV